MTVLSKSPVAKAESFWSECIYWHLGCRFCLYFHLEVLNLWYFINKIEWFEWSIILPLCFFFYSYGFLHPSSETDFKIYKINDMRVISCVCSVLSKKQSIWMKLIEAKLFFLVTPTIWTFVITLHYDELIWLRRNPLYRRWGK